MFRHWTFGRRIAASFALLVVLTVAVGIVALVSLRSVVSSKDDVIDDASATLVAAKGLQADRWEISASGRAFLLTGEPRYLDQRTAARERFDATLAVLREQDSGAEAQRQLDVVAQNEAAFLEASGTVITLRQSGAGIDEVARAFEDTDAERQAFSESVADFIALETQRLDADTEDSSDSASSAQWLVAVIAIGAVVIASVVAFLLTRLLRRQIGTSVGEVQSSSAELQASANQQAVGASEQATAMSEITTTISELLATSRQIAESSQRVAQIAEQTAQSGRAGEDTVTRALESMAGIRGHVDLVVTHMLDLGQKSQQIGAVLEILSELAEQTNILAINATIEAAGAGEHGSRFAVVADEIRKLADRVAGSTKEVRDLIDDVRSAVNTTVMATEMGSKAVDAGAGQVTQVAASFRDIAAAAFTANEAAREIELSTKQQTTAVEQVNVAIANVAQATRETEASSSQTLQTASQLSNLSVELRRLVEAGAGG
jgi:methyl-accepting chemotaxis protein